MNALNKERTNGQKPAIALVGPTASGKTGLALLVAEALGTEIIGVDSRQIYRRLDIGRVGFPRHNMLQVRNG